MNTNIAAKVYTRGYCAKIKNLNLVGFSCDSIGLCRSTPSKSFWRFKCRSLNTSNTRTLLSSGRGVYNIPTFSVWCCWTRERNIQEEDSIPKKKTVINHFECKVGIFFLLIFSYILSDSLSRDELSDAPWEIVRLIPHSTHILCADVHLI